MALLGLLLERIVPERELAREGTIYILSARAQLSGDGSRMTRAVYRVAVDTVVMGPQV